MFEHPYVDEARAKSEMVTPEQRTAARAVAVKTAVLLRNEGGVLPLKKTVRVDCGDWAAGGLEAGHDGIVESGGAL